jgi:hypothetical protein
MASDAPWHKRMNLSQSRFDLDIKQFTKLRDKFTSLLEEFNRLSEENIAADRSELLTLKMLWVTYPIQGGVDSDPGTNGTNGHK